jgi:hypothetical protein
MTLEEGPPADPPFRLCLQNDFSMVVTIVAKTGAVG